MNVRSSFSIALLTSMLVNCTPRPESDYASQTGSDQAGADEVSSGAETAMEPSVGASDGGALDVDQSVAVIYEVRSKSDIPAFVASMMALSDTDQDGAVTLDEYDILAPALAQEDNTTTPSAEGGPVANPGAEDGGITSGSEPVRSETFFTLNAGPDGVLSANELEAALTSRFDTADVNGDGTLDASESKTFAASMLIEAD